MVKRNSCNDYQIIGLPSISPMYLPHQGSNENKYSGSSISHSSTIASGGAIGKNKLPLVKRYNSGVTSSNNIIKEEANAAITSSNHSSVLST